MPDNALHDIEATQSVLGRLIYRRPGALARHIQRTLVEPYDSIVLYKFRDHLPAIDDVSGNLEFFSQSLEWMAGDIPNYPTPRVVRVLQRDWFMEVCAALGALGGVAAIAGFLYQIRRDRRVEHQVPRTSVSTHPVPAGPGQVRMQRRVHRRIESVSTNSIGNFEIEQVHEYFEEQLEFVEVYESPETIRRFYYRREADEESECSS